ncbi:MAG TPA: UDP-N-acetylmuramoyl-tripeptide--D-alanyl-D-alanine ligase [Verrucomicrobiae bacterium]|nr:UDP-N-acetylmuramoyl-tripeptide--D-alanyl-D-alanine ligase [Verrucomicrobiae bacterium]
MDFRSLKYVAEACEARQLDGSPETLVNRVVSDSRLTQPGDVFFALAGDRFDGHDFLPDVAERGVTAVVVDKSRLPKDLACTVLTVDNPRGALGRLGARYRRDFELPVVAIAGSNGKTTTKELVASVLRQKLKVIWSEASFNNDIGVPVTLLKLEAVHQAAVLEVGTNHPGELAPLVKMIQPKFGIITSIGREHLEFFHDLAGVVQEEGALAELLPPDGKLWINGDSEWTGKIVARCAAKVERVGLNHGNDWQASEIRMDAHGMTFVLTAPKPEFAGEYRIQLLGRHHVVNAMFAVAVGAELGLSRAEIQQGLAECAPAKMRMQQWNWNGVCVLDDAYNANADSMTAALETLRDLPCGGRRVAVLGDMAELGSHSPTAHAEIGRLAAQLPVDQLFAIGGMANIVADAARAAGLKNVSEFAGPEMAVDAVKKYLQAGDVLLLKASRSTRLERLGAALKAAGAKD